MEKAGRRLELEKSERLLEVKAGRRLERWRRQGGGLS